MQVDIKFVHLELDKELKIYIQRKLELTLFRTAAYISAISITLDKNPAANLSSEDIHCLLKISIVDLPDVVIDDTQSDLYYVIDRAMQKAQRSIERIVTQQL